MIFKAPCPPVGELRSVKFFLLACYLGLKFSNLGDVVLRKQSDSTVSQMYFGL
jgi:hypothetical protein